MNKGIVISLFYLNLLGLGLMLGMFTLTHEAYYLMLALGNAMSAFLMFDIIKRRGW